MIRGNRIVSLPVYICYIRCRKAKAQTLRVCHYEQRTAAALLPITAVGSPAPGCSTASALLGFTLSAASADLVSGSDVGGLVDGVTAILECPHIASPLVASKLVELLLAMLKSDHRSAGAFASPAASRALRLAVLGAGRCASSQHARLLLLHVAVLRQVCA